MPDESILGVVLAGGGSRRMGFDKRRLESGGRNLVARSALVLVPVCDEVVISIQPGSSWEAGDFRVIEDRRPDQGPLAGLESALGYARKSGGSVFLLACDLPNVDARTVRHIVERAAPEPERDAVVPSVEGRRQPLCALYRPGAQAEVRRRLDSGERSMMGLLETVSVLDVEIGAGLAFYRADLFRNLNRPADLAEVEVRPR